VSKLAWGGSLNKNGSDYIRRLREADKVIEFLEIIKKELNQEDQVQITKSIDIIVDYISKLSENKD